MESIGTAPPRAAPSGAGFAYLELEVPAAMADAVQRHHAALASFAASLREAGVEEEMAARSIAAMVESYRGELTAAVASYREQIDVGR